MSEVRPGSKTEVQVIRVEGGRAQRARRDRVATEEPLEIRLSAGGATQRVAVTMRTPGADFELAAGFLYSEGMIAQREDIGTIRYCVDADLDEAQRYNVVNVALNRQTLPDLRGLERYFMISSACGVCGKATIDSVLARITSIQKPHPLDPPLRVRRRGRGVRSLGDGTTQTLSPDVITQLPSKLRAAQSLFETTGGLHAAALFTEEGDLLALREDVGRHNAMDKLIGWALMQGRLPLRADIVLVSGRASFELVQKAAVAGIPALCAISAPSSLAIATARAAGMTLIGFLREDRFNLYCGGERIAGHKESKHRRDCPDC
jgi:FdhD protein